MHISFMLHIGLLNAASVYWLYCTVMELLSADVCVGENIGYRRREADRDTSQSG